MVEEYSNDIQYKERIEEPVLELDNIAVCLHYVVPYSKPIKKPLAYPHSPVFQSMELDLMSYGYQVRKLFGSQCEHEKTISVEIEFPEFVEYHTEGRKEKLIAKRLKLNACAIVSSTIFLVSGIRIWHVVLVPDENETFNEYDIIKLIHLYDGRTENTNLDEKVKFRIKHAEDNNDINKKVTVKGLLGALLKHPKDCPDDCKPKGGTVQILTGQETNGSLEIMRYITGKSTAGCSVNLADVMDTVQSAHNSGSINEYNNIVKQLSKGTKEGKALLVICGIVTGIFDFSEIDIEELFDTLKPTYASPGYIIIINRCTMVNIAKDDRILARLKDKVGVSPYLLIPHAVLLHNEELLEDSQITLDSLFRIKNENGKFIKDSLGSMDKLLRIMNDEELIKDTKVKLNKLFGIKNVLLHRLWLFLNFDILKFKVPDRHPVSLYELEYARLHIDRNLNSLYLPNVFNYEGEKILYELGAEIRGTNSRMTEIQAKLEELEGQVNAAWEHKRDRGQMFIAVLLSVFTVIGLRDVISYLAEGTQLESELWSVLFSLVIIVGLLIYFLWGIKRPT